ncbi:hypothetical protein I79_026159 [Cricetulus griseus]|uniref:Uncharacterized protein n=1 Tax=Cricetulus griseus TaxID=10029 RepID=G3IQ65_CRIGR|nr:hypothetical protein I79_026159 [Cricetulus griseus]
MLIRQVICHSLYPQSRTTFLEPLFLLLEDFLLMSETSGKKFLHTAGFLSGINGLPAEPPPRRQPLVFGYEPCLIG